MFSPSPRLVLIVFLCLATTSPIVAADVDQTLTRGPYLQLATPSSITVVWRTLGSTKPMVRFGESVERLDRVAADEAIVVRTSKEEAVIGGAAQLHSAPENTFQYEARIDGLDADKKYFYAVFDGDRKLVGGDSEHYFRTHPEVGQKRAFRFWVVGDSGTGDDNQKAVHRAMLDYQAAGQPPLDLYLHVGDMAYPKGTDDEFQRKFFDIYQPTLRNTVCWAAMGNHEGYTSKGISGIGPYYDAYVTPKKAEAGGLPSATEAYYSFDYGNVHFICLDSHDLDRKPAGVMAQWLRADLDRTHADWLIAFWHHPPYTKGSHDSDKEGSLIEMREHIMPILEAGGVDLVLTGHSHIYERSMLIDGAYQTPTTAAGVVLDDGDGNPQSEGAYRKSAGLHPHQGAVQVVTGNGGAKLGRKGTMPIMKTVVVEHGSVLVDVDDDQLTGIMVNRDGVRRDLFGIVKRGEVRPQIVANPRTLPTYSAVKPPPAAPKKAAAIPADAVALIEPHAEWEYLAGEHPTGDAWLVPDFIGGKSWRSGFAGFGYGDDDDLTVLKDMAGRYTTVYIRNEFELDTGERDKIIGLGLVINYDDAFVAYLNGHEVLRVGVGEGRGAKADDIASHNAKEYEHFSLDKALEYLEDDDNILAIEGHNRGRTSSDFSLDPYLVARKKPQAAN